MYSEVTAAYRELSPGWPPLQKRRKIARLTLLHKSIHGESALEMPSYIKKAQLSTTILPQRQVN